MDFNYGERRPTGSEMEKARRICELYAIKLRMTAPRAIELRYRFPYTEAAWPMIGLSVAEHSFMMAQLINPIYLEFLHIFADKNISPWQMEAVALHHDDAEALTGDAATDVDGVTRSMKDAAEQMSILRQYHDMACQSFMQLQYSSYEARQAYVFKLVKMMDAVDLVLFAQYCVRNGVGKIRRSADGDGFELMAFGEAYKIDKRTHKEVSEYLVGEKRQGQETVRVSEIMYDHSLPRVEKLGCPELTWLFRLLCERAFEFPFEAYNMINLPMDFAGLA